ncbi:hypothetical protein [Arthrobacter monumenti]
MTTIDFETKTSSPDRSAPQPSSPAAAFTPADRTMNHKLAAVPTCNKCKTDEYLYIEEYTPPVINDDGELARLGDTSYFCTRCLQYGAHAVPPLWTPDSRS